MRDRDRRHDRDDDFPAPGSVQPHPPKASDIERAARWLKKLLASGPMMQFDIKHQAEAAGIYDSLLQKAKKSLRVISENWNDQNDFAQYKCWFWSLPKRERTLFENDDE